MWSSRPWGGVQSWSAGAARGSTFSPLNLTALRGWWKSDTGITIATGVSQWNDQSGNGNHLVQATGAQQPSRTLGAINGLPSIDFDGVNDTMAVAIGGLAQPETVFIVFSQLTGTINDAVFDGTSGATTMCLEQQASPNLRIRAGVLGANNGNLALATFGLATCIFNGVTSELQINNTTSTVSDAGTSAGGGLMLGARTGGTNFGNVAIAEVILMAAVATAGERTNVRAYCQARYGVGA